MESHKSQPTAIDNIFTEIKENVSYLDKFGIQALFIATENRDEVYSAFSGCGEEFTKRNNLIQHFRRYCFKWPDADNLFTPDDSDTVELKFLPVDSVEHVLKHPTIEKNTNGRWVPSEDFGETTEEEDGSDKISENIHVRSERIESIQREENHDEKSERRNGRAKRIASNKLNEGSSLKTIRFDMADLGNRKVKLKSSSAEHKDPTGAEESGKQNHKCKICAKLFCTRSVLKQHMCVHTGVWPYTCETCSKSFSQKGHYNEHMLTHTGEKAYDCEICNKKYTTKRNLSRHVSTVHDKDQLMMNNLKLMRQNINEEPECPIGEVRDDTHCSTIDLPEVSRVHKLPFACSECGKILKTRSHFYTHKLIHQLNQTGERPHPCIVCGKRFLTYSHMKRHSRVHDDLRPYRCPECSKSFKTAFLLKVHLRTHSTEKNFQCNECGKSFKTSSHFYTHKLIHKLQETGERPHLCMVCGKSFYTSSHLKHHMKVHVDDRPFRCVVCGKDFKWAIALKTHARTHTGERPYKCPSCQKCFTQPGHLKSHTSLHVGEKPCVCHVCCKTFANGGSLKTHMRKQHKSKNAASSANIDLSNDIVDAGACSSSRNSFACSVCCKQFPCTSSLRHHLIDHTGEKQFICDLCGKTFSAKQSMEAHLKMHEHDVS